MAQENIKKEDTNKNEVEELKLKCEEYLNGWKRERADFLNYKKDEAERISSLVKYANEDIIYKLIPILDNFNLAAKHLQDQGFLQIKKQLEDLLAKEGIETIEVLGKPFDPNTMEILGTASTENSGESKEISGVPDSAEADTVAEEVQKGYTLNGKLIRPAKVKIVK
jgi:molecular chaperone GrpE